MASTLTAFDAVRARIASALLAPSGQREVGRFVLRAAQRRSLREIRAALQQYGGALVADAAGSGKTVLALATAAGYDDVLVIVPAAVREQWQRAAARAQVAVRIATQESLSRGRAPEPAALVIVDEAHHFRNAASARYRVLASLVSGRQLLLLTATPVVNRRSERDALLALFLGRRVPSPSVLERVVIRRASETQRTQVVELHPLPTAADIPDVANALRELPPPFPTVDGAAATALVRITLAFAWASSLAALDAALRRRVQRGAVLADALRNGRWPTHDALRDWIVGTDATQLAFDFAWLGSANDAAHDAARTLPRDAAATLQTHLTAVRALQRSVHARVATDIAARADAIRALVARESPRRIVLLAHHAETVRALHSALRDLPGTVAIVGARVHAAAGRWSRDEVLRRLGPDAAPFRADDIRDIRLLLATDILAEGVELQGCATLIHGDVAWTPARLEQRLGRIARDGQRAEVHVTQFALPDAAERLLVLRQRLRRKRRARTSALAASDAQATLRAALAAWLPPDDAVQSADAATPFVTPSASGPRVAAAWATHAGFVALLDDCDEERRSVAGIRASARIIAGICREGRWTVGTRAELITTCVRGAGAAASVAAPALRTVRSLLQRWQRRERARTAMAAGDGIDPAILRQLMRRVDAWLSDQPIASRPAAGRRLDAVKQTLHRLRGIAAERELARALREGTPEAAIAAIERLATTARESTRAASGRLSALLLLRPRSPDAPVPPAPSPGSAAPR